MQALIFDFSRVLVFPKDPNYDGSLNGLHSKLSSEPNYNILDHITPNQELLNFLENETGNIRKFIFTGGSIQSVPLLSKAIGHIFERIFTTEEVGQKNEPGSYIKITGLTGLEPTSTFFTDNLEENIQAAHTAGLKTHHFQTTTKLFVPLQE